MHGLRRRIGTGIATVGLLTIGLGLTAAPSHADAPKDCNGVFSGSPGGSLSLLGNMSTDPSVDSPVVAGQTISVTAAWSTSDWAGSTLDKVDACVRIAGADRDDLGHEEKPASNDGSFQHSFVVSADAPVGADVVCVRVGVHGQPSGANPSTQKSARVCWDVVTASSGGNTTTQGGGNTTTQGGGNTTTQVEGATVTQNGGTNSTDVAAGNATPTTGTGGATSEVSGISRDAGNTTGSGTLAASNAQTTQGGAQATSGSALPATSGAINPQALASTGSATQALVLMAGLALLLGGLAFSFSSPRRAIA